MAYETFSFIQFFFSVFWGNFLHKLSYPPLSYHDVHLSKIWNHDVTTTSQRGKCKKLSPSQKKTFFIFSKTMIYVHLKSIRFQNNVCTIIDLKTKDCFKNEWTLATFQKYRQIMEWFPDEDSVI